MIKSVITSYSRFLLASFFTFFIVVNVKAQDSSSYVTIKASEKYNKSAGYQKRWGKHYRAEWNTPVKFRKAYLDTLAGGVVPYALGGGRQSQSLRLRDKNGREYVLRSIDKSFGKALPEIAQGTFIETLANDQVSIGHPYSAVTIAPMARAAGIFYTDPRIYYIPAQDALGEFKDSIGNTLYLFEKRPDENWETAENFGNPKNIVGTEKMLEELYADNGVTIDQMLFARTRLFDMFIGDWGRHEDQWRWAEFKNGNKTVYKPVPRDRDQAYTKFDGRWLKIALSLANADHMQSFEHSIDDVQSYNFPARNLDYHLLNELDHQDWVNIARDLKTRLTDNVIESAIKKFPEEVFNISGPDIIAKLKSRRDMLPLYASEYFSFITKETEVTGSSGNEHFVVNRLSDTTTEVEVYRLTAGNISEPTPYYQRSFNNTETNEIRIYGIGGTDKFTVTGNAGKGIPVRLIGGPGKDEYSDASNTSNGRRDTWIYDNRDNTINGNTETRRKLSSDISIHSFVYNSFQYDKTSVRPMIFYNFEDRIYVGLAFKKQKQGWRKHPFATKHSLDVKYSIQQKAFSSTYEGRFNQALGSFDLGLLLNYDLVRWTNFFGIGNDTELMTDDNDFNRMRTRQFIAAPLIEKRINNRFRISLTPFYQFIKIINDTSRFIAKHFVQQPPAGFYDPKHFAGADLQFLYQNLNDSILSTKGFSVLLGLNKTQGLKNSEASFMRYSGELNLFIPLGRTFSLALSGGGSTMNGDAEFYQLNRIGGSRSLRGHPRDRFYGKTTVYNQNELRFIKDVRSYLYNGKFGIFALYDIGRVWLEGEKSDQWHPAYGGGIILSPFNKISVAASYAISKEDNNFHLALIRPF